MIYLIDEPIEPNSHSKYIQDIIRRYTSVEISIMAVSKNPTFGEICDILNNLSSIVQPIDIVLCSWVIEGDEYIDELFNDLSDRCWVVAAAGNFNKDIIHWTPARAERVITVACLNKSGVKAALSNWSGSKKLVWVPGTNFDVGWKNSSGTSVSAAIYTAFLAESIKCRDLTLLDKLLEEHQQSVFTQINNQDIK